VSILCLWQELRHFISVDRILEQKKENAMINVIASISIETGSLSGFLEIFRANMLKVREERGCIEYFPLVDIDAKLTPQILDENVVTIIEKWESLEALREHLEAPHMLAYREKVKNIVTGLSLKVLVEA
jgi:quinol monooxygenase YgiN